MAVVSPGDNVTRADLVRPRGLDPPMHGRDCDPHVGGWRSGKHEPSLPGEQRRGEEGWSFKIRPRLLHSENSGPPEDLIRH